MLQYVSVRHLIVLLCSNDWHLQLISWTELLLNSVSSGLIMTVSVEGESNMTARTKRSEYMATPW